MWYIDLFFALIVAIIAVLVLSMALGWERPSREGPAAGLLFLFIILFLFIWAGGVWVTPFGPPMWGSYFLTFLFVGIIIVLLLAAAAPPRRRRVMTPNEARQEAEAEEAAAAAFGVFFWILLIVLIVALIVSYID